MDLAVNRKEFFEQREFMNTGETLGIELIGTGSALQIASQLLEKSALPFYPVPKTIAGGAGISSPVLLTIATDWEQMSAPVKTGSRMLSMLASIASTAASVSQTMAGFQRRQEDWDFQADQANKEMEQIDKQVLAADIRKQIAEKDLEYHEEQISRAADVEDFLKLKFTNKDLYNWNISQINKIYFPAYQLAYQLAKYAEKALQYELGLDPTDSKYIQANYWDSLKKGLMAGELLEHDLRRMEMAHIEQHAREYELTRHISLRRLNPYALLGLKVNGQCTIDIPEYLFDLDAPGHYMRRIRQLSVSLPAVAGPFTGVHCTLTLNKSSVRKSALLTGPNSDVYARITEDSRFEEYYSAIQSIVTSSGQNDSGLFEANLQDERYLPFEGAGVIGNWTLKLPAEFRQFDYNTINDVIFHVRYTAREGGEALAAAASAHTSAILSDASNTVQAQLFSLRHDFPNEWHKMIQDPDSNLSIVIKRDHFPYLIQGRTVGIAGKELQVVRMETLADESPAILSDTLAGLNTEGEGEVVLDGAVLRDAEEAFLILRYTVT
jgi:hypothetical protein